MHLLGYRHLSPAGMVLPCKRFRGESNNLSHGRPWNKTATPDAQRGRNVDRLILRLKAVLGLPASGEFHIG